MANDKNNKKPRGLRLVELAQVATYLGCDPKLLVIALRHLAEASSVIEYSPGLSMMTVPADKWVCRAYLDEEGAALDKIVLKVFHKLGGQYALKELASVVAWELL